MSMEKNGFQISDFRFQKRKFGSQILNFGYFTAYLKSHILYIPRRPISNLKSQISNYLLVGLLMMCAAGASAAPQITLTPPQPGPAFGATPERYLTEKARLQKMEQLA